MAKKRTLPLYWRYVYGLRNVNLIDTHVVILVRKETRVRFAIIRLCVKELGNTAAGSHRLVATVQLPVAGPIHTATHKLALYVVPGHEVVRTGASNRLFHRVFQYHLQVGLVQTGCNTNSQLNDENDAQQDSKLCI